jgi:hypothetical protein
VIATMTLDAIIGFIALGICLLLCLGGLGIGVLNLSDGRGYGWGWIAGSIVSAIVVLVAWWWGMAFTLSGDYHAWNVKEGTVERVAKRLVSAGDKGMAERYVVTINGRPYGIDDTRAALVEPGDKVSLRCKKDYEWGVPREAHGWACRWNKVPGA